jgi:hypothetical protein
MKRNLIALLISFTVTLIVGYLLLSLKIDRSVPGTIGIQLIARCELVYFITRLQSVNMLIVAYPRMDIIRL